MPSVEVCTPEQVSAEGPLRSGSNTEMRTDSFFRQGWHLHPSSEDKDNRFDVLGLSPHPGYMVALQVLTNHFSDVEMFFLMCRIGTETRENGDHESVLGWAPQKLTLR